MRKIGPAPIVGFFTLAGLALLLAVVTTQALLAGLPSGDFRGVLLFLTGFLTKREIFGSKEPATPGWRLSSFIEPMLNTMNRKFSLAVWR